jgi:type IV secretion system protein VirD4
MTQRTTPAWGIGRPSDAASEVWMLGLLALAASIGVLIGGAHLAAILFGAHHPLSGVTAEEVVRSLARLSRHVGDPRQAWPPAVQGDLPGPFAYWAVTAGLGAGCVLLGMRGVTWWRRLTGPGARRRERLGVDPRSRLAEVKDLRPMIVRGPVAGRCIVGRACRRRGPLVATEDEGQRPPRWRRKRGRKGGRTSVIVIGPARSGKTSGLAIPAVLEWTGPALVCSVKPDVMHTTIGRRRAMGDVKVFDPRHSSGLRSSGWSPLRACTTLSGAMRTATSLADAAPRGNVESADFWKATAEDLLGPTLYAAAIGGMRLRDVGRWIVRQDGVVQGRRSHGDSELSEVAEILKRAGGDPQRSEDEREHALQALETLEATWRLDEKTRDSIFLTARTVLKPWADPEIAASSDVSEIDPAWLWSGDNTLYVCAPAHQQEQLVPVFSGLLEEVINAAYEAASSHGGDLPRRLLIVVDEAANIAPLRYLPRYAATCAGVGIQLLTVWQDMAQIKVRYGAAANTVVNNHGTKVFLAGISDDATLEYVSRLLGEEEVVHVSRSLDRFGTRQSANEAVAVRRVAPMEVVRRVAYNEGVMIHGTLRPAHLFLRPWFRDRQLTRVVAASADPEILQPEPGPACPSCPAGSGGSGASPEFSDAAEQAAPEGV